MTISGNSRGNIHKFPYKYISNKWNAYAEWGLKFKEKTSKIASNDHIIMTINNHLPPHRFFKTYISILWGWHDTIYHPLLYHPYQCPLVSHNNPIDQFGPSFLCICKSPVSNTHYGRNHLLQKICQC